jgi:hypothetical protein
MKCKAPAESAFADCLSAGGGLDGASWAKGEDGEVVEGRPHCEAGYAFFKHNQAFRPGDVWRMKVEGGRRAGAGFAGEAYDPTRHYETEDSTACVHLGDGSTYIYSGLSLDEEQHDHYDYLGPHVPSSPPFEMALRVDHDVPQVQFNEDGVWHDFAPGQGEGRTALKAGPWFPYLFLRGGDLVSDHRVGRSKATKSAGMKCKAPAECAVAEAQEWDAGACVS